MTMPNSRITVLAMIPLLSLGVACKRRAHASKQKEVVTDKAFPGGKPGARRFIYLEGNLYKVGECDHDGTPSASSCDKILGELDAKLLESNFMYQKELVLAEQRLRMSELELAKLYVQNQEFMTELSNAEKKAQPSLEDIAKIEKSIQELTPRLESLSGVVQERRQAFLAASGSPSQLIDVTKMPVADIEKKLNDLNSQLGGENNDDVAGKSLLEKIKKSGMVIEVNERQKENSNFEKESLALDRLIELYIDLMRLSKTSYVMSFYTNEYLQLFHNIDNATWESKLSIDWISIGSIDTRGYDRSSQYFRNATTCNKLDNCAGFSFKKSKKSDEKSEWYPIFQRDYPPNTWPNSYRPLILISPPPSYFDTAHQLTNVSLFQGKEGPDCSDKYLVVSQYVVKGYRSVATLCDMLAKNVEKREPLRFYKISNAGSDSGECRKFNDPDSSGALLRNCSAAFEEGLKFAAEKPRLKSSAEMPKNQ